MAVSNFVQDSFIGGEWSPFSQGKIKDPNYSRAMSLCRNSYPLEEGAWIRRSGTHFSGTTYKGLPGRVMPFAFEEDAPYIMEFTDGVLRMFAATDTTSGLLNTLPHDFRIVTTNDNQGVSNISTANPAVVTTSGEPGWATGDQGMFLFDSSVNAGFTPLLRNRLFTITVLSSTTFSIADGITGATIDGSTLGWASPAASTIIFVRALAITTPYTAGTWQQLRKVQAETETLLLHGSFPPENLSVSTLPTASSFATFSLSKISFLDGPYLDPPTDGTTLNVGIPASLGRLPFFGTWSGIAWNGTVFCAVANGSGSAATSTDGLAWTIRTLPVATNWSAIAWNGTVFCAIAGDGNAATSVDGITWAAQTLPVGNILAWTAIAWNGTVFCAVAIAAGADLNTNIGTSPDGATWTIRGAADNGYAFTGIAWNGSVFCAVANQYLTVDSAVFSTSSHTSPDGITWAIHRDLMSDNLTWSAIAWNGTVFCAVASNSNTINISSDGANWTTETLPPAINWTAIGWNGSYFLATTGGGSAIYATSPNGITWVSHDTPGGINIGALCSDGIGAGAFFVLVSIANNISLKDSGGIIGDVRLTATSMASINGGIGFVSTDINRSIRINSEPLPYISTASYVIGNSVSFNGAYYTCIQNASGNQPDISPTFWALNTSAAVWTWGIIQSVVSALTVTISLQGPPLLYSSAIFTWRLGLYSITSGWPTNGVYYEGRIWLTGAVANRIDSSIVNGITATTLDMTPTGPDGTVADDNGISYTFNSDDVNPIFWMKGINAGIVCGTQAGEWLISAPTTGPITATNIQAHRGTTYGSENIEPADTQLTISFVQRFNRTLLEYFPDVFSGRFIAPNLTENGKHLTKAGIAEIRYQQELLPIIWNRMADGTLAGATYERENLFSSQPPKFIAWHRHDLGSARVVESITSGPTADGALDTITMVTNDPATNIRHIEHFDSIFNVGDAITSGWFCDDAVTPSGGVLTSAGVNSTITFYGLWHLNGKKVTVSCGGVDVGDFTVASGAVTVPIDSVIDGPFTTAYLASISSTTAYGEQACAIDGPGVRYTVPAAIGFTYTSQGQLLRPDTVEDGRSPTGPGAGKRRRLGFFSANMVATQGIKFGTDFTNLHTAQLTSPGGNLALTALQLFTGVYSQPVDDSWGLDSMLCWQIDRPYPACIASLSGFMTQTDN